MVVIELWVAENMYILIRMCFEIERMLMKVDMILWLEYEYVLYILYITVKIDSFHHKIFYMRHSMVGLVLTVIEIGF